MAGFGNIGETLGSNLKVMTLNVRGLKNRIKRNSTFKQIRREKIHIAALQETYLSSNDMLQVEREMGGIVHYSKADGRSKGLITYFDKSLQVENIALLVKTDRIIVSSVTIDGHVMHIINIYAPCIENEKNLFLKEISNIINTHIPPECINNIICLGDFNMVISNTLDIVSGGQHPKVTSDRFRSTMNRLALSDVWRVQHPTEKDFTWSRGTPAVARRLDYIFVGDTLLPVIANSQIKSLGLSDHRAVIVEISCAQEKRGPGFYKMNTSLLSDEVYVEMISETINRSIEENKSLNPHLRWEMVKVSIRETSQQYSRFKQRMRKNDIKKCMETLNQVQKEFADRPDELELSRKIDYIKRELELRLIEETRGASMRAGIKWIEKGERGNKFFLGLERARAKNNVIHKLKSSISDGTVSSNEEILEEVYRFYERLYHEDKDEEMSFNLQRNFMENLNIPRLGEEDKIFLDAPINEEEALTALKKMKNGSAPGPDGIPAEFYKVFWPLVQQTLLDCYRYSLEVGSLSISQGKGIISLLHKGKGLSREELKNWRPITLTNVDYKILAKLLAIRLQKVIQNLIHPNQYGFVKGRNIAGLLRELDDIIEFQKYTKSKHIILSIDYEKAFDTISKNALISIGRAFGFGDVFMLWIETFMKNRKACVKNNGFISGEFEVQRGIRQGCPLSPLLFILAVELLAIKIRQEPSIKGIKLPNTIQHTKIRQYADDTTFLLRDIVDFREVLSKIKQFAEFSGLKLNKDKSKAFCPGNATFYGDQQQGIKFSSELFVLGTHFRSDAAACDIAENWEPKIQALENILGAWAKRDLSILGKILIIKTFGLSIFMYLIQSIGMPEGVMRQVNTLLFKFIWKKKYTNSRAFEKVKRNTMFNGPEKGGVKMCNLFNTQYAFYLHWVEKLLISEKEGDEWTKLPLHYLQAIGGSASFESNVPVKAFRGLGTIKSAFWKRAIQVWLELSSPVDSKQQPILDQVLYNNRNITYKRTHLWLPECIKHGILRVRDVCLGNRLMSFQEFTESYRDLPGKCMLYNVLANAISPLLLELDVAREQELGVYFRGQLVGEIGRKGFLQLIHKFEEPYIVNMWKRKLGVDITEKHWLVSYTTTGEIRLRVLQWKILHNIFPTNILLHRMGIKESKNCARCKTEDLIEHFMVECAAVKPLWKEIENQIAVYTGKRIDLNVSRILFGLTDEESLNKHQVQQVNLAILIGKMVVSKHKYGEKRNIIDIYHREARIRKLWGKEQGEAWA